MDELKNENEELENMDDEVITLVDEEGKESNFAVVDILEVEGTEYAVLMPVVDDCDCEECAANDEDDDDGEVIILKFAVDEEGNDILEDIEDDEEWEKVADAWEDMLDEE